MPTALRLRSAHDAGAVQHCNAHRNHDAIRIADMREFAGVVAASRVAPSRLAVRLRSGVDAGTSRSVTTKTPATSRQGPRSCHRCRQGAWRSIERCAQHARAQGSQYHQRELKPAPRALAARLHHAGHRSKILVQMQPERVARVAFCSGTITKRSSVMKSDRSGLCSPDGAGPAGRGPGQPDG